MSAVGSTVAGGISDSDFASLRSIALRELGIEISGEKKSLLVSRLAKRLRHLGLDGFSEYTELLNTGQSAEELEEFVACVTTNVTRFFREPHHFDHLETQLIPDIEKRASRGEQVRLWSSACSTGEEPYSAAMILARHLSDRALSNVKILASDVNVKVLEAAQSAEYPKSEADAARADLRGFFQPSPNDPGRVVLADKVRNLVTFRYMNLAKTWPVRGPFDAIFCRNVAIYFPQNVQEDLWVKFAKVLRKNGSMYIGHSERLAGPANTRFRFLGSTMYQLTN
ncbi:CheR family methyltransferase [Poseidonocella sedimentorum]|uniref:Chemotaxis protein methyltransferase n=1 Tax=Poseidonocella sedimentorum TaxID=871652 RepID=A0A1I6EHY8_9RHOB|nr:protein-glutamate O-methyltransferase CheR [Poseidonocella sedimentorum]SFR17161.1 MCP methyltransferase, CheR-type [Poseidonocella sedimentorum]